VSKSCLLPCVKMFLPPSWSDNPYETKFGDATTSPGGQVDASPNVGICNRPLLQTVFFSPINVLSQINQRPMNKSIVHSTKNRFHQHQFSHNLSSWLRKTCEMKNYLNFFSFKNLFMSNVFMNELFYPFGKILLR
jgi:hypothetical protein